MNQEFADKKVLITGGLGFIGSNLAHRLVQFGAQVLIVDSLVPAYGGNIFNVSGIEEVVKVNFADIRDQHAMAYLVKGQDYIFNLAGQVSHMDSVEDPVTDLEINCLAQVRLLEACRASNPKTRILFASTRQIYGRPLSLPVYESHPLDPVDPNGVNKIAGEMYHILYAKIHKLRTTCLRLTNTYGPRMRVVDARQTFIGWWFRQLLEGSEIRIFGDGEQVRDFTFVDDVVDAFLRCAVKPAAVGKVFNLGGPSIRLKELAPLMVKLHGNGSFRFVPFPDERKAIDIGDYRGDYTLLEKCTGWKPLVSLDEGISRTIDYYRRYAKHYW